MNVLRMALGSIKEDFDGFMLFSCRNGLLSANRIIPDLRIVPESKETDRTCAPWVAGCFLLVSIQQSKGNKSPFNICTELL